MSLSRTIFKPGAPSTRFTGGWSLSTTAMMVSAARTGRPAACRSPCSEPMFFTGLETNGVVRSDFLDGLAVMLDTAAAIGDDHRLAQRIGMPRGPRADFECHASVRRSQIWKRASASDCLPRLSADAVAANQRWSSASARSPRRKASPRHKSRSPPAGDSRSVPSRCWSMRCGFAVRCRPARRSAKPATDSPFQAASEIVSTQRSRRFFL